MTFVRGLFDDLVEKRLWPIAAALLVGLVAVPVVLSKSVEPAASEAPSALGRTPAIAAPAVSLAQETGKPRLRTGSAHNPFVQQHLPKAMPTTTAATSLGPAIAGATTGTSGAGNVVTTGGSLGGGGGTTTVPAKPSGPVFAAVLRFGRAGDAKPRPAVEPLKALPSANNPLLVYLGASRTGAAKFLVSSDATAQGDGTCKPSGKVCTTLYLEPGQTEFFDVGAAGKTVQYELELVRIQRIS